MKKPIAVDLFSGCGGLTLGLKKAGFRVVGAVELNPLAVETYKTNHKHVMIWPTDIRNVPASEVMRRLKLRRGELDLLAGCPPCQGFSTMTTLNGHAFKRDDRNDLIFELLRFARRLKPKAVMMENVPRLAKDRRFKVLIRGLRQAGYLCRSSVLDCSRYGVPQRRRRLILLAGRRGEIPFASPCRRIYSIRDVLKKIERRAKNDPLHTTVERRSARIMEIIRRIPKSGGSRGDLPLRRQLKCHRRCTGFKDVYGRMDWDDVAPTITSGCCNPSKGRFLHPSRNRAITVREAALLQSFPLSYRLSLRKGKFAAAEMIGNALPPEFVRRHAGEIVRYLEGNHARRKYRRTPARRANPNSTGRS